MAVSNLPMIDLSPFLHRALHIGTDPRISAAFFVYPDDTTVDGRDIASGASNSLSICS
jgi:hypothetical protein